MENRIALVADDHEEMRNLVRDILSANGFEVISAENGKAAYAALRNQPFDLIVTDNQMGENPLHWGVEVIKAAKLLQLGAKTILISTEDVKNHGADRFMIKGEGFVTKLEDSIHEWFNLALYDRSV